MECYRGVERTCYQGKEVTSGGSQSPQRSCAGVPSVGYTRDITGASIAVMFKIFAGIVMSVQPIRDPLSRHTPPRVTV